MGYLIYHKNSCMQATGLSKLGKYTILQDIHGLSYILHTGACKSPGYLTNPFHSEGLSHTD